MLLPRMILLVCYGTMGRTVWLNHFKEMKDRNLTIYKLIETASKTIQFYSCFTSLRWTLTQERFNSTIFGDYVLQKICSKSVRSTWIWFPIHMSFRACVINMLIQHCSVHEYFWYILDHKKHVRIHVICDGLGHFDVWFSLLPNKCELRRITWFTIKIGFLQIKRSRAETVCSRSIVVAKLQQK